MVLRVVSANYSIQCSSKILYNIIFYVFTFENTVSYIELDERSWSSVAICYEQFLLIGLVIYTAAVVSLNNTVMNTVLGMFHVKLSFRAV